MLCKEKCTRVTVWVFFNGTNNFNSDHSQKTEKTAMFFFADYMFFSLPTHTSKVKSAARFVFMKLNIHFDVRKINK